MKIIAIEGIDKAGKHTQTKLLAEAIQQRGYSVRVTGFPQYNTPIGKLIEQYLHEEWETDQATFELLMAADKSHQQRWFKQLEESGVDFLILDRYTGSQMAYAIASGMEGAWVGQIIRHLRKPDLEILIDIPVKESMKRQVRGDQNDRFESDHGLLSAVRYMYRKRIPIVINGMRGEAEIQERIFNIVARQFQNEYPRLKEDVLLGQK